MKLFYGLFLLSAATAPATAFIPNSDYLQAELARFADGRIVGNSLLPSSFESSTMLTSINQQPPLSSTPSPSSVLGGANEFVTQMVADMSPFTNIQDALSAATSHWEVSSSILTSNLMSTTIDFTPDLSTLLPSMIMLTSMAVTILVSEKSSEEKSRNVFELSPTTKSVVPTVVDEITFDWNVPAATNDLLQVPASTENLEEAFAMSASSSIKFGDETKDVYKMRSTIEDNADEVIASSTAALAFADTVLASSTSVEAANVPAEEECKSLQTAVAATDITSSAKDVLSDTVEQGQKEAAIFKSSLFGQTRRVANSAIMKVTKLLLQGRQYIKILLACIEKLQKTTVRVVLSQSSKKYALVKMYFARSQSLIKNMLTFSRQEM